MKSRLLALLLFAPLVSAGSLALHDDDGLVKAPQGLEAVAALADFNVVVLVSSQKGHGAAFDRYVDTAFSGPSNVVIGVDPEGHHTHIWAGSAVGIPSSVLGSISISANQYFRAKDWAGGVSEMARRLVSAKTRTFATVPATPRNLVAEIPVQQPIQAPVNWTSVFGYSIAFACFIGILAIIIRAQRKKREPEPTYQRSKFPYADAEDTRQRQEKQIKVSGGSSSGAGMLFTGVGTGHSGVAVQGTFRPVTNQPSTVYVDRSNPVLDYMVMDSLLHNHNQPAPVIVQPQYVAPAPAPRAPEPAPSSSGSSWFDGGSTSGGSDWGSSSSSDSSSGSDFGGGDSGGSDW